MFICGQSGAVDAKPVMPPLSNWAFYNKLILIRAKIPSKMGKKDLISCKEQTKRSL